MIVVGYQGIGKSSIGGKHNCIDLESSNFYIDGKRDNDWYKIYCNGETIAEDNVSRFLMTLEEEEMLKTGADSEEDNVEDEE